MVPQQSLVVMSPGLPTVQAGGALIPAPTPPVTEPPVHVLPMYTKPRPVIPRYRAISGLISVVIVFGLLCAGAGYYAKVTGKLSFLHQLYGDARQKNIKITPARQLPIPPRDAQPGPAFDIIPSATTASRIDSQHAVALDHTNQFKVGQTFYLTYSVHPKSPGAVTFKWYTNSVFYRTSDPIPIKDTRGTYTGSVEMLYPEAVEGRVEIYWNNQLAITLLFVVQPN